MPSNITPAATWTASIPTPDDGEGATGAGIDGFAQALANREEFLHSLITSTGVKIWRTVASIAALKALTGMAANEIVLVGDTAAGFNVFAYHSTAALTGDDVLIVTPTSGVGRWITPLYQSLGVANGIPVYNASGKLALGKVTNQIYEVVSGALGASANNSTTTYATVHSRAVSISTAVGDKVIITAHGGLSATSGAGSANMTRLTVSENGGADIALTETEHFFDDAATIYRVSYTTVRTVATAGTFEARWQIKSGTATKAVTLNTPAVITLQVIRP